MATPSSAQPASHTGDDRGPDSATFVAADAHALVIGVGPGRREDAALVREVLADPRYGGYQPGRVHLVAGTEATPHGIRTALRELSERVGPESTAVVCCLSPVVVIPPRDDTHDFDTLVLSERRGDVLPVPELYRFFGTMPARGVLFAYEGSHPGVGLANAGPGRVVIAAGLTGESSYGSDEIGRTEPGRALGRFPRALVEALRETTGAGGARVARLFEHVRAAMAREAARDAAHERPRQTPVLTGDLTRDFVMTGGTAVVTGPATAPPPMPNAYALLVGIDAYPSAPLTEPARGALAMRAALIDGGYAPANVRLLLDREATRDAILAALDDTLRRADQDATVLVYFAGHGTTVPAGRVRERDVQEPALVPVDYQEGQFITARDLDEHLARARSRRVAVVADSDHAEGIGGDAPGRVWLAASRLDQVGYEAPGGPGRFTAALLAGLQGAAADADGAVRVLTLFEYAHQQVAASPDARGVYPTVGGDLSDDFVVARSPGTLPSALVAAADGHYYDAYLAFAADDQELIMSQVLPPLIEAGVRVAVSQDVGLPGAYRVAMLERGLVRSRRWLAVASAAYSDGEAERALQNAARAVSVDTAARLAYLRPGEGNAPLGVAAARTFPLAALHNGDGLPTLLAWIRGEAEPAADPRLRVRLVADAGVDAEALALVREALAASSLVTVAPDGANAFVHVHLLAPRPAAGADDAVPQLGALDAATWAVVDGSGRLLAPPIPSAAGYRVAERVEALACYQRVLTLANPNPASRLRGRVTLELLRREDDGTWAPPEPGPDGRPVFEEGARIGFRVTSQHDAPVYVYLLDLGPTRTVGLIYPPTTGVQNRLEPGATLDLVGRRPDARGYPITWPEGFPYDPDADGVPEGTEVVKLVVTEAPVDLSFVQQTGMRSAGWPARAGRSEAERQLRAAFGLTDRGDSGGVPGADDWDTRDRTFVLRQAGQGRLVVVGSPAPMVAPFSASTQRTLLLAEAGRRAAGHPAVGTAHLLAGLYDEMRGWTRAVVEAIDADSRWLELSALASLMGFTAPLPHALPRVEPAPSYALRTLALTDEARRALAAGVRLAGEVGPDTVSGRHLLAGLLSLPEDPTARWLADALRVERAALHRVVTRALDGDTTREQLVAQVLALRTAPAGRTLSHDAAVQTLAFHPDGVTLAVGYYDGGVRVYDAPTGALLATLAVPNGLVVAGLAWSPGGATLVANAWQGGAHAWSWEGGRPGEPAPYGWPVSDGPVKWLTFSPDGHWLLVQHAEPGTERGDFVVCDASTFPDRWRKRQTGISGPVSDEKYEAAFAPDSRTVVLVNDTSAVHAPIRANVKVPSRTSSSPPP